MTTVLAYLQNILTVFAPWLLLYAGVLSLFIVPILLFWFWSLLIDGPMVPQNGRRR